ncbi:MAG: hypothetical protein IJZ25_02380, partial [Lachnospiraceae bacterium]|nr:hypothetical protein [Lachnospiraceae bacterium]
MRKKTIITITLTAMLSLMAACNTAPEEVVIPTTAPTETLAPTTEPVAEPTETPVPTEEPTVAPTATETPTVAPTATPEPTPTEVVAPVATAVPTETPMHEHVWVLETVEATCTLDGSSVEVCECGEQQNAATIPATGHTVEKKVTKEATVEQEGAWEEVCTVCGEVVNSGSVDKLVPTATPTPTATPVPTNTPTPTPSLKPTATPKPTDTPKPTATPAPTRIPVESYTWWDVNHELIRYTDESCTEIERMWYDLNLVSEYITLYNYSDEVTGEPKDVYVYDYPSDDAKVVYTIKTFPLASSTTHRGQVKAIERCLETGWYKVSYGKDKNGNDKIGYVDDEYVYCGTIGGFTTDGYHVPGYEYCQFEMPYLGPTHKLREMEDFSLAVGEKKWVNIRSKAYNLYYQLYYPSLREGLNTAKLVGVFTIEDPSVVEIQKCKFFQEEFGYYSINGTYSPTVIARSLGTTSVTLTEYEVSNYQY